MISTRVAISERSRSAASCPWSCRSRWSAWPTTYPSSEAAPSFCRCADRRPGGSEKLLPSPAFRFSVGVVSHSAEQNFTARQDMLLKRNGRRLLIVGGEQIDDMAVLRVGQLHSPGLV